MQTTTKTATEAITQTQQATIVTTGILGAFFIGMSFLAAFAKTPTPTTQKQVLVVQQPAALLISDITSATYQPYDIGTQNPQVLLGADKNIIFGTIGQGDNAPQYTDNSALTTSKQLYASVQNPHPAMTIRVEIGHSTYKTLCVPQATNTTPATTTYYFDINGNAYLSAQLTGLPAANCTAMAQKSFTPGFMWHAGPNTFYPALTASVLNITFLRDSIGQRYYSFNNDAFDYLEGNGTTFSNSPLALSFHSNENPVTFPARTIAVEAFEATDPTVLCVPETSVQGFSYENGSPSTFYFFDKEGTAYTDTLLTQPATTKTCPQLLAASFAPTNVYAGRLASPINIDSGFSINLIKDNRVYATYANNSGVDLIADLETGIPQSTSPLIVRLKNDSASQLELVANSLMVGTDVGDVNLCIPESTITAFDTEDKGFVDYFYDKDGMPFSDNLLLEPVACATR